MPVTCLPLYCSPVRIVNVASTAHMFGKMDFDDLQSRNNYDRWRAYGEPKGRPRTHTAQFTAAAALRC